MPVFVACLNAGLLMLVISLESPCRTVQMIITPYGFMAIDMFMRVYNRSLKVLVETVDCFERRHYYSFKVSVEVLSSRAVLALKGT